MCIQERDISGAQVAELSAKVARLQEEASNAAQTLEAGASAGTVLSTD